MRSWLCQPMLEGMAGKSATNMNMTREDGFQPKSSDNGMLTAEWGC